MTSCPKCQYERTSADRAPEWQCPRCGVAYCKVTQSPIANSATANRETISRPDRPKKKSALARIIPASLIIGVLVMLAYQTLGPSSSIKNGGTVVSAVTIRPVADPSVKPMEHNFEPQGFQGLPWGADESAITGAFGEKVVRLDSPQRYFKSHVDLVIPQYMVGGVLMEANFQMDNETNRLAGVLLTRTADPHPENPQRTFDKEHKDLLAQLTTAFGTGGTASGKSATKWTRGDTSIVLDYFFQVGIDDHLTIHYTPSGN